MQKGFDHLLRPFLDYLAFEKRYSKHTLLSYENDLTDFLHFSKQGFEVGQLSEIKAMHVKNWLVFLKDNENSSRTINRKISALKSLFKFCLKKGIIEQSPMVNIMSPKAPKRLPQFIEAGSMQQLLTNMEFPDSEAGDQEKLIITLFYLTGIRKSELLSVRVSDINLSNLYLKVLGKGKKERIIPMVEELASAIEAFLAKYVRSEFLFTNEDGHPLTPRKVYTIVNKYLSAVTTIEKKSPHVLRHSFATHLLNEGADINAIKELLGHASLAATQVYTHNSIEKLKEVFKKAHPKA